MENSTSEVKTIAWAAIGLTIFGLFVVIVMAYFFIMSKASDEILKNLRNNMLSANYSRIYELEDETEAGRYPLVASAVNALSELNDGDLLYVGVHTRSGAAAAYDRHQYFTYKNVTLQLGTVGGTVTKNPCQYPIDDATRLLMRYTDTTCQVVFVESSYQISGSSNVLYAVEVYVNN